MKIKKYTKYIVAILVIALMITGCQPASTETSTVSEKEPIRFSDTSWQTLWINNAIASFIVEQGYGYPVEIIEVTTPVSQQSLVDGDIDVNLELWRMNLLEWYNENTSSGKIIDLGPTFEKSTQGFYVPRYVIEGDPERGIEPMAPDLKSVSDLPKYVDLFEDPENPDKGYFVSCITGWRCAQVNQAKMHAYGLDEMFTIQEPGSSGALDAVIAGAYQKGEPIFTYYWEPTWLMGLYDMVLLEEPEYSDECWAEITSYVEGEITLEEVTENAGCAYENYTINKGINAGLKDRAPEVVDFLEKMNVGTDPLNKVSAYMTDNETTADEAAAWFFENYEERWKSWVPADVAEKVEAALNQAE